jgi:hypothetical protein
MPISTCQHKAVELRKFDDFGGADGWGAAAKTTRSLDLLLLVRLGAEGLWLAGLGASIVGFALEGALRKICLGRKCQNR